MLRFICFLLVTSYVITITHSVETREGSLTYHTGLLGLQLQSYLIKSNQNLVFSPLCLHIVLSMLYVGSTNKTKSNLQPDFTYEPDLIAETYEKLLQNLKLLENAELELANKLYINDSREISEDYKNSVSKYFQGEAENIKFVNTIVAARKINSWVSEKTKNRIKNTLKIKDINKKTTFVIVSSLYFKARWAYAFDDLQKDKFYTSEKQSIDCDMINVTANVQYRESAFLKAQVVKIPYQDPAISFVVVLPKAITGLSSLEERFKYLTSTVPDDPLKGNYTTRKMNITMPKFKIEQTIDFKESLTKVGLGFLFKDELNIENITSRKTKLNKLVQKLSIEIENKGTEIETGTDSVNATYVVQANVATSFSYDTKLDFKVDHPFLFFITRDWEGGTHIIYQGRVVRPQ